MPELNVLHITVIAVMAVIGTIVGWALRDRRSRLEKFAVNTMGDIQAAIRDNESAVEDGSIAESANDMRDKLQAIKGVGPAIEKTLNEMGIFRFQQIAEMSEYDIDRIARSLKGLRSRIYREDWLGQARELRDQNISI
jgi:predicted flap endonuclease-1-like 5' DNA nuclease